MPGDLYCWFAAVDEADGVSDLAVCDSARPTAQVEAGVASLVDGVGDAFAFDLVFRPRTLQLGFLALAGISLAAALPASRLPNYHPDEAIPDPEKQPAG